MPSAISTSPASSTRRSYSPAASSSASISTAGVSIMGPGGCRVASTAGTEMAEIYNPKGPLPLSRPSHEFTRKPEKGFLRIFMWRWRMWFESTFVLSMLEPWEKLMLVTIFVTIGFFFMSAIIKFLPHHITVMRRRAMYYLVGQEGDERLLWQWLGLAQGQGSTNIGIVSGGSGAGMLKEL